MDPCWNPCFNNRNPQFLTLYTHITSYYYIYILCRHVNLSRSLRSDISLADRSRGKYQADRACSCLWRCGCRVGSATIKLRMVAEQVHPANAARSNLVRRTLLAGDITLSGSRLTLQTPRGLLSVGLVQRFVDFWVLDPCSSLLCSRIGVPLQYGSSRWFSNSGSFRDAAIGWIASASLAGAAEST